MVCCLAAMALAMRGVAAKSATADEMIHVAGGYSYWTLNDYRLQPENGNWAQRIDAIPAVLSGARFPTLDQKAWRTSNAWEMSDQFFFRSGNDADGLLRSARWMVAVVTALLGLIVFLWARRIFGHAGAWVSLIVVLFSPEVLANGGLATSDVISATAFVAATWALWVGLHRPTAITLAVSVLATAALFLSKYSALIFVPIAACLLTARLLRPPRRTKALAAVTVVHVVGVLAIIWASYGFRYSAFNAKHGVAERFSDPWSEVLDSTLTSRSVAWARDHQVLPEGYLFGLSHVLAYSRNRAAFLDGELRYGGWHRFFPYATAMKATVPALLLGTASLLLIGVLAYRRGKQPVSSPPLYELIPIVTLFVWYWAFALTSRLNIGYRHMLPAVIAIALLMGVLGDPLAQALRERKPWLGWIVGFLLAWHVAEALRISPHFLAYFNQLAGGPARGYTHLVDSSLDWGQDLPGLKRWLDDEGLSTSTREPVYLSYFGTSRPEYYRIRAETLPGFPDRVVERRPPRIGGGVYCISATMLQTVYLPDAAGPWTADYERRYQDVLYNLRGFDQTADDPRARAALLRQTGAEFWGRLFGVYERMRFGRLAAYLRARTPDATIGYSILIYRLTDDEVSRAIYGPPPQR